nr:hypothetical protein [uncultured Actinotalea sp.]
MSDDTRGPAGTPADRAAGASSRGGPPTGGAGSAAGAGGPARGSGRGRLWAALAVVLVVVAVVVAVLLLVNRPEPEEPAPAPQAETVTLPVPTPTVEPVALPDGASAFLQAMPQEVLAFALAEVAEEPQLLAEGALEAYRLVYDDGAQQIVATAGQWRDTDAVTARFDEIVAAESQAAGVPVEEAGAPDGAATDDATDPTDPTGTAAPDDGATDDASADATSSPTGPRLEQGFVEVDGTQVGRFLQLTRADGTGSLWWTNGTALLRLDGPGAALRDVYAAFPL